MSESLTPAGFPHPGWAGVTRLLSLVGRSECPPRPADELLSAWHEASGTTLPFPEWCDPPARRLAATLCEPQGPRRVDAAVVAFAQARSGADHPAERVAADLTALLQLVDASTSRVSPLDPVGLVARALAAWAAEQVAVVSTASCVDPVTGLVNGGFLRARLRELHAQCDALAIAPSMAFGSLVLRLDLGAVPTADRMSARFGVGRTLLRVFRAGETVAVLSTSRFAAVMPAYALDRAEGDVQLALARLVELAGALPGIDRCPFGDDADSTWRSLAGVPDGHFSAPSLRGSGRGGGAVRGTR
jgi:hypothetical protein